MHISLHINSQGCNQIYKETKSKEVLVSSISNMYKETRGQMLWQSSDLNGVAKICSLLCNDDDLEDLVD